MYESKFLTAYLLNNFLVGLITKESLIKEKCYEETFGERNGEGMVPFSMPISVTILNYLFVTVAVQTTTVSGPDTSKRPITYGQQL